MMNYIRKMILDLLIGSNKLIIYFLLVIQSEDILGMLLLSIIYIYKIIKQL